MTAVGGKSNLADWKYKILKDLFKARVRKGFMVFSIAIELPRSPALSTIVEAYLPPAIQV
jgi:hypothetical protein